MPRPISRIVAWVALWGAALFTALHARDLNWAHFAVAFVLIDFVGYLPGTLAQRRARRGRIAPLYHHLYNFTHNWLTLALVALTWAALYRPEWAMLALPLHLAGDRGLLGNFRKPLDRPFEEVRA
jgi:hypothetical protein